MVLLKLTKEEAKLLFEILPVDPDFGDKKTSKTYEGLRKKVAEAKWQEIADKDKNGKNRTNQDTRKLRC